MRFVVNGTFPYRGLRLAGFVAALLITMPLGAQAREATIVVAVARDTTNGAAASIGRGLTFGVEEALRTAQLFGAQLRVARVHDAGAIASAGSSARAVWVLAGAAEWCAAVRAALTDTPVALIDAGCPSGAPPLAREFRVRADLHPPAPDSTAGAASTTRVVLWHESLERFGAAQLNDRFRRRFGTAMDSDAWAGWIATKLAAEALLLSAARRLDPVTVLLDERAAFDGHKGVPLRFDAVSRTLVQPVYLVIGVPGAEQVRDLPSPPETRAP